MCHSVRHPFANSSALSDPRAYVIVDIFGVKIKGLLDSGATGSLINGVAWAKIAALGHRLQTQDAQQVILADGSRQAIYGSVVVPVVLNSILHLTRLLVVPHLKEQLILGADWWKAMGLVVDLKHQIYTFHEELNSISSTPAIIGHSLLTAKQKDELKSLIEEYKRKSGDKLGCTSRFEHVIDTGASQPIKQRYYQVSPFIQKIMSDELDKMLQQGVVEPSTSAWSSPVVLVKKKDGEQRFCIDFREVNKVTKKDAYPLPFVSSILDRLRNGKYLTSLDVKSAFWQVPLEESSREKTAFTVPYRGLFQFRRMPFGLHNSAQRWQRIIDYVLGPSLEPYVFCYLDDVIIVTGSFDEHMTVLREVLRRLQEEGITLSWDKCHFCRSELRYLGHIVNENGLGVDPEKVQAILGFPQPKTVKQVRRFNGLASWYRRFIPNFAEVMAPLTQLLRKNKQFKWEEEQESAFRKVQALLVSAPLLACPDFSRPFILQTDASKSGLGAILAQNFDNGEKPVAYASRSLTRAEKKYSASEIECLCVLWAIQKFRPYIEGGSFTVITDHSALRWLHNLKDPTGRLGRWALQLQGYDFNIQHRPGRLHTAADALSRVNEVAAIEIQTTPADRWYCKMKERVGGEPLAYPLWKVENDMLFHHMQNPRDVLETDQPWKIVVPKEQRIQALADCHDTATSAHLGIYKTIHRLKQLYFWPGMVTDATKYVLRCSTCQANKPDQRRPIGTFGKQRKVTEPWQVITADIMGPLPRSSNRNRYLLVVCDYFSKFCLLHPMPEVTTAPITKYIENQVFLMFGVPKVIITDNGVQFRSNQFKDLAEKYKVDIWYTPNYHPQSNPTERANRVIKTAIRSYITTSQKKWDSEIPKIGFALRAAVHESTGYSPAYVNFGRELKKSGNEHTLQTNNQEVPLIETFDLHCSKISHLQEVYDKVTKSLKAAYEKGQHSYDLRRRPVSFEPGQSVWKRNHVLSDATQDFSSKLAPKYIPCRILKKLSNTAYELTDATGKNLGVWHPKDFKQSPPEDM